MIFVVSEDLASVSLICSALRTRLQRPIVAIDNGFMALRLLGLNPVHTVLLDLKHLPAAWLRAFGESYPDVRCFALGCGLLDDTPKSSILPEHTVFIGDASDWDEIARRVETEIVEAPDDGMSIAAADLEGPLTLLAMSQKSAELQISAGRLTGRIMIASGRVLQAECGSQSGEEAAYAIMTWPSPHVRTISWRPPEGFTPALDLPILPFLHESARRKDEMQHLTQNRELKAITSRLGQRTGVGVVVLVQLDTGVTVSACGDTELRAHALESAFRAARAGPDAASACPAAPKAATVLWQEHRVLVCARVRPRMALSVLSTNKAGIEALIADVCATAGEIEGLVRSVLGSGESGGLDKMAMMW